MLELSVGLARGEDPAPALRAPLAIRRPGTRETAAPAAPRPAPEGGLWRRMLARWTATALYIPH